MTTQQPGVVIAGYRIESLIGRGGMAVVYRAEDMRLGRKVALKLLSPQLADNEQFRQRFVMESRLAASLDHPNIVPIYEAGESAGQLFIAMRYVVGSDLKALLTASGPLTPERTLQILGQVADALDSAHGAGLVHRDVKPGNVLVAAGAERPWQVRGDHVYLTDFGLTKRTAGLSSGLTGTGHFLGTADYVSPEQIQGRPVGPATDIYALGCVAYECLTGQLPFRREEDAALLWAHLVEPPPPVTAARPEVPAAVNAVVARAMAKEPADRYGSCEEFVDELELALGGHASPSGPAEPRVHGGAAAVRPDTASDRSGPFAPISASVDHQPDLVDDAGSDRDDDDRGAGRAQEPVAAPAALTDSDDLPTVVGVAGATPSDVTGDPRPSGSPRRRLAPRMVAVGLLTLALGAGAVVVGMPESGKATAVVAEPADSPGSYAFTEPPAPGAAAAELTAASVVPAEGGDPAGSAGAVVTVSGDTVGLYGGMGAEACDADGLATYFETHPDRAEAWAGAQDIETGQIRDFLASLTPVVLRTDTAVTNHSFRDGSAQPYQAVLQAGSAVLIDERGVPRVRCACGNPLRPPAELEAVEYTGEPWPELESSSVTVVQPAPATIQTFVLVVEQQDTAVVVDRPRGSDGAYDQPAAPEVVEAALTFSAENPASAVSSGNTSSGDQPAGESTSSSTTSTGEDTDPGTDPGTGEGTNPGANSGTDPGSREGANFGTGTDPGTGEGTDPGTGEGTDPGTGEGTDPGTDPGTGEGTDPGPGGGTEPGPGGGTDPGPGGGTEPGPGGGTDPGPGGGTEPGPGGGTDPGPGGGTEPGPGEGTDPGTDPGTGEGTDPGPGGGTDPGTGGGTDPGPGGGTEPGPGEGTEPGPGEGTDPGTGEGTEPGPGEGTDPGTGEGTDPGPGGGTDPGTGGGTDPGPGGGTEPGPGEGTDPGSGGGTEPGPGEGTDPGSGGGTEEGSGSGSEGGADSETDGGAPPEEAPPPPTSA
ncbi:serine/threonine-protein kinase [Modestobacter marinus]|uniref:serine/threonine-protein kinase n=1 Tax=Modestobacter marinus TaxID=477641 RepID=UPI001C9745C4|nr:serine/threonine-protein kinase [Modestobacter marinus]